MIDLSPKQKISLHESNARLNIWEGAVRSGKSFASLIRWLEYIQTAPKGNMVVVGRTATTIKRNFVDEIMNMIGADAKYYIGKGELKLWGRLIYLVGAADERSETKIRGATFAGAYVDEATLIPESFWTMLLSRISVEGAKIFATTNPDSPFHWLKKNYIDRAQELDLKTFKFLIEDNPSLTQGFIKSLKAEYQGLWKRRYIDGEWCLAEGTVYDFFDESIHVIPYPLNQGHYYVVGCDYGTTNPTAYVMLGFNPMVYPNMWIEKEYYYDSSKHMRQKTDTEYASDLANFIEGYPIKAIYIDPSAESFKVECRRQSIRNILDAKNEVLDGIRFVAGLLVNGTLKITRQCPQLIQEFQSYSWDARSKDLGIDKPSKVNDHCFAEGTKIKTLSGDIPIEMLGRGEKVLTPIGYKTINEIFCHEDDIYEYIILGKKIRCTKDHKFFTINGWKKSSDLIDSDIFLINIGEQICLKKSSFLTELDIEGIYPPKIHPIENISERIKQIALKVMDISIEIFGNSIMEKYPKDTIFITSTEIPQTMTLATLNLFQFMNTYPIIKKIFLKNKENILENIVKELDLLQKNGTHQKKEKNGIENILKTQSEKLNPLNTYANNVIQNITQKLSNDQNFVRINVNQNGEEITSLMMNVEYVLSVIKNLEQINTQTINAVQKNVHKNIDLKLESIKQNSVNIAKKNLDIGINLKSIVANLVPCTYVGKQKVYNLNIEDLHVYYAEDILSLNCLDALRYLTFSHFGMNLGSENRLTKEKLEEIKRKAYMEAI